MVLEIEPSVSSLLEKYSTTKPIFEKKKKLFKNGTLERVVCILLVKFAAFLKEVPPRFRHNFFCLNAERGGKSLSTGKPEY